MYALSGDNVISAEKVFVLASFYNILRQTMTVFLPVGIAQLAEAFISVKRIQVIIRLSTRFIQIPFKSN